MKLICGNCSREDSVPDGFRHELYCRYCGTKMLGKEPQATSSKTAVMIVDPDLSTVSAIRQVLLDDGYSVTGHTNPISALKDFDSNPGWYHVVICNAVLEQMTGLGFISNLKRVRADVNVILMTNDHMSAKDIENFPVIEILTKPISAAKLTGAIEMCLSLNPLTIKLRQVT